jgi:S1-C subfamily serine protease
MSTLILASMLLFPGRAQDLTPEALYKKALPSVMTLVAETQSGSAVGTGFLVVKDGVVATAYHVIKDASSVVAHFSSGEVVDVIGVIDKDETRDMALVKIKAKSRPVLDIADGEPEIGSKCYIIGAPRDLEFSISDGIIGQIRNLNEVKQYQFTCPASPGNSGGPLLNARGEVLGIVDWQRNDGQNLNFAVAAIYAKVLDSNLAPKPWPPAPKAPGPPRVVDIYLTKDNGKGEPGKRAVQIKPADKVFHCVLDMKPLSADTNFSATLIAVDAAGVKNFEVTSTMISAKKGLLSLDFKFSLPRPWPVGKYRVAVQAGAVPVRAVNFDIK